jgi:hypothetical protein
MKKSVVVFLGGAAVASALMAQVVITSLDRSGTLTWTNSLANATYRVEWASSVTGAWQNFNALTNLLSIKATSNIVSVQVPMFYRVVWTDPPAPQPLGNYNYTAYDPAGSLLATGRFSLLWTNKPGPGMLQGTWSFERVPSYQGTMFHQDGSGQLLFGWIDGFSMSLETADSFDNNTYLRGELYGNQFAGTWEWGGFGGCDSGGDFVAQKLTNGD